MRKHILVIEDDRVLNNLMVEQLGHLGYITHGVTSWSATKSYLSNKEPNLVLLDCRLPDTDGHKVISEIAQFYPLIVLTAFGSVQSAVQAIKDGADEYLVKPINLDELELFVQRVLENAAMRQAHQFCKDRMKALLDRAMIGQSDAMKRVYSLIDAVAPSDMTVLIGGESGVGKELVAQEIHRRSNRSDHNFVALDCCTLQETLFESELFGHERGAFTSADRKKSGLIEGAEGGTLFLDEIGEIDATIQAKLLRVLETGTFRRLGGTKDLKANVRIIAATNRNLEDMSIDGSFRADLYFRLSSFLIDVPPLRQRRDDIPELVAHFINNHDFSKRIRKKITSSALKQLVSYDWRGNIRELKNVVERALILSNGHREIRTDHLTFAASQSHSKMGVSLSFSEEPTLENIQQHYIESVLSKYSGHRATAAKVLGISERNLYRLIQKYELH